MSTSYYLSKVILFKFCPGENICAMVDGAEQTFSIIRLNKNNPYEPVMFCDFIKHLLYVTYVINMNKNVQNRMKQERPR